MLLTRGRVLVFQNYIMGDTFTQSLCTFHRHRNMALRGLKITCVCIAVLFISCSIIL